MLNARIDISVFVISIFVAFLIFFSIIIDVDELVRGTGKISTASENKKIQHFEGGILKQIFVKEGQEVKKGEVLVEIINVMFISQQKELKETLKRLHVSKKKLEALIDNKPFDIAELYKDNLKDNSFIRYLEDQRKNYIDSISKRKTLEKVYDVQKNAKLYKKREIEVSLANKKIERKLKKESYQLTHNQYKKGNIPQKVYIEEKLKNQMLETEIENLKNQIPTLNEEIKEIDLKKKIELEGFGLEWFKLLSDIELRIIKTTQTLNTLKDKNTRMNVVSPINGIINEIKFKTIGGTIKQGEEILNITPINEDLIIEGEIKDRDRSKIWIGQDVNIEVNALDSTIDGYLKGEIIYISADSFIKQNTNEVVYNIKVKFKKGKKLENSLKKIKPGMTTNLNIKVGQRKIYEYVIKPIKYVKNQAFVEP